MSFTINQFDESLGEFKTAEMGLSLGEVRQSILDRIREDLHWAKIISSTNKDNLASSFPI